MRDLPNDFQLARHGTATRRHTTNRHRRYLRVNFCDNATLDLVTNYMRDMKTRIVHSIYNYWVLMTIVYLLLLLLEFA